MIRDVGGRMSERCVGEIGSCVGLYSLLVGMSMLFNSLSLVPVNCIVNHVSALYFVVFQESWEF